MCQKKLQFPQRLKLLQIIFSLRNQLQGRLQLGEVQAVQMLLAKNQAQKINKNFSTT